MAHSPETKARALADYLEIGFTATIQKHGIGRKTLYEWIKSAGSLDTPRTPKIKNSRSSRAAVAKYVPEAGSAPITRPAPTAERFDTALRTFLISTVDMLQAITETCSDPAFIKENPEGANVLVQTVLARADMLAAMVREPSPEQQQPEE
jgi:transposase-like protein